jgi:hypothetical protein
MMTTTMSESKGKASAEPDYEEEAEEEALFLKERPMERLGWANLPVEIMLYVFRYLGPQEKNAVRLVCSEWCDLLDATNEELILYPRYTLAQERTAIERLAKRQPKVRSLDIRRKQYPSAITEKLAAGRALRAFVLHDLVRLSLSQGMLPYHDLGDRFPNLQFFVGCQMDAQSDTQRKLGELLAQWPRLLELGWSVKDHNSYTKGPSLAFAPPLRSLHLEADAWAHLAKTTPGDLERLGATLQEVTITKVDSIEHNLDQLRLMPQLRSLILQGKAHLYNPSFEFLKQLPHLQSLILQDFSCVTSGMFKLLPFGFCMLTLKNIGAIWPLDFDPRSFEADDCDERYRPGESGGAHRTLTHLSVVCSMAGDPSRDPKPLPTLPRLFVYSVMQSHFSRPNLLGPFFAACPRLALVMVTAHEYFHLAPSRCQNLDIHKLHPVIRASPTNTCCFGTSPTLWNMQGADRLGAELIRPQSWVHVDSLAEIEKDYLVATSSIWSGQVFPRSSLNELGRTIRSPHQYRAERLSSSRHIF